MTVSPNAQFWFDQSRTYNKEVYEFGHRVGSQPILVVIAPPNMNGVVNEFEIPMPQGAIRQIFEWAEAERVGNMSYDKVALVNLVKWLGKNGPGVPMPPDYRKLLNEVLNG